MKQLSRRSGATAPYAAIKRFVLHGHAAGLALLGALRAHGIVGTLNRTVRAVASGWKGTSVSGFDRRYGVETEARVPLWKLTIDSPHRQAGGRYQSLSPALIHRSIASLPIDHARFSFVDYGSGKGRALLVAADFPFRSITGVEFALELHEIALANIARYLGARRRQVNSVHMDASHFNLTAGPLVLFFYNPFGPPVMSSVIETIGTATSGEDVWVIYHNPVHAELFARSGYFEAVTTGEPWAVFRRLTAVR